MRRRFWFSRFCRANLLKAAARDGVLPVAYQSGMVWIGIHLATSGIQVDRSKKSLQSYGNIRILVRSIRCDDS